MIFVFGSNLAGRHGAGAALFARHHHGAEYGVGEGPTGNAYALPTKDSQIKTRALVDIKISVDKFLDYARAHPEQTFQITRVGCGFAGFTDGQIAPMFIDAPDNCIFSHHWNTWLPKARTWTDMYPS